MDIVPPLWLQHLKVDARGFLAPAEASWLNEKDPDLARMDAHRAFVLGLHRACAICGYPLISGEPVYRAFGQKDAAQIRLYEADTMTAEYSGPGHLSCMLYSVNVCPYMREGTSRLGKASEINPGGRRGTRAALMGFEDYAVLLATEASPTPFQFAFVRLVDDIPYRNGSELFERYSDSILRERSLLDMSQPPLYWDGSREVERELVRLEQRIRPRVVPTDRPWGSARIAGIHYQAHRLR